MRLVHKRLGSQLGGWSATLAMVVSLATPTLLPSAVHAAPPAQAPAQQRAYARELYGNGQALFRQGDYAGAQRSFEEAYKVVPNPVVLLSIAECQVRTEQFVGAIETLRTYLKERPTAPDKTQVEGQIEALLAKPATLTVQSSVEGAAILVDTNDTGKKTPSDLELAAGDHNIALKLDGYVPNEQSVTLSPGGRDTVRITLMPAQAAAPVAVAEPTPPPPEPKRHAGKAVWIATGVAGAGLVTGAILGGVALKKKNEFDDKPSESLADKGERLALFADVGFGIAAAAGITAVVLYLTSDKPAEAEEDSSQQAFSVSPALSPQRAGVVGAFRF